MGRYSLPEHTDHKLARQSSMLHPLPENEAARLRLLRLHDILDTASEKAFDELTRLAATLFDVPISLISLVDENRQWFKSRVGLEAEQTPRSHAFCAHAIMGPELMVVEDATQDPRFRSNPLVQGEPRIRFYAGAPLELEPGRCIGTLCVIDRKPRRLDERQRESLASLRNAVVSQLELRKAMEELRSLRSLLPVCAWCSSIRVEGPQGTSWHGLKDYVNGLSGVTHSICPDCSESMTAEMNGMGRGPAEGEAPTSAISS